MNKQLLKDALGWGIILWLIGYVFFWLTIVIQLTIWPIILIEVVITLFVLFRMVKSADFKHYLILTVAWTVIEVVFNFLYFTPYLNLIFAILAWFIMPISFVIMLSLLFKMIKSSDFRRYLILTVALFVIIEVAFIYVKPAIWYDTSDMYLYIKSALTFALPLVVGWMKKRKNNEQAKQ